MCCIEHMQLHLKYFHLLVTHIAEVLACLWILSFAGSSSELLLAVASESKASCRCCKTAWLERLNSLSAVMVDAAVDESRKDKLWFVSACRGSIPEYMDSRLSRDKSPVWHSLFSPSSWWLQCSTACSPSWVSNLLCSLNARLCSPACLESFSFTASSSTARDNGCSEFKLSAQGCTEARGKQLRPASQWEYGGDTLVRGREEWCTSTPYGPHLGAALCPCSRQTSWL